MPQKVVRELAVGFYTVFKFSLFVNQQVVQLTFSRFEFHLR